MKPENHSEIRNPHSALKYAQVCSPEAKYCILKKTTREFSNAECGIRNAELFKCGIRNSRQAPASGTGGTGLHAELAAGKMHDEVRLMFFIAVQYTKGMRRRDYLAFVNFEINISLNPLKVLQIRRYDGSTCFTSCGSYQNIMRYP